jgi:hypothetical protein
LRYSRAAFFAATAASINVAFFAALPVLRGFSRSVKQDSVANAVSGGVNKANVAKSGVDYPAPCLYTLEQ